MKQSIDTPKWGTYTRWIGAQPTWLVVLVSFSGMLLGWHLLVTWRDYKPFLLPGPVDVWRQLIILIAEGDLLPHTFYTISEIIPGLLIGCLIAMPLGYLLAKSPLAERLLSPYLIASQAVPVIAIAPLIAIWIPSTYWARVTVTILVVFFPVLINIIAGLRSVPPELYDLMKSLQATNWQIFRKLEIPAALPIILAGLKVGATLSVIGTLVGEFVQIKSFGLGFLLNTARYQLRTDRVFVILLTLGIIALSLYGIVVLIEKYLLRWQTNK